jgi:hypothetical protein
MSDRFIFVLIMLAIALPIAFIMDRNSWRKRPREALERILREKDWARVGAALKEIKRRGEDITPYVPVVLELMAADSASVRTAGKLALKDHFPEIAREIPEYEATGPEDIRAAILSPILQRYGTERNG